MNVFIPLLALILIASGSIPAECRSVTFYSDGAIVELEATANKDSIAVALPDTILKGTLRIKPANGTTIRRIDFLSAMAEPGKGERELDSLLEQRNRLNDRLRALATREEIFKSAAKAQSGKAPRKTKADPDPMKSIRQGTDFAIAQLEAVYTSRRKTELELRRIDSRISATKNGGRETENIARVIVSPVRGKIKASYVISGQSWTPRYDMYLDGGTTAQIQMSGLFSDAFSGYLLHASPAPLAESATARVFPVQPGPIGRLKTFGLPVSDVHFGTGQQNSFSYVLMNQEQFYLPAGDANVYKDGEYIGRVRFEGISSGRKKTVSTGM